LEDGATHAGGIHASGLGDGFAQIEEDILTGLSWDDLATIRGWSSLPLLVKGVMTGEDARLAAEHGVEGRSEVWVDGGVRRGLDLAIARALGARGVLIGRPVFWALAAGGQAGVE